ncbi:lantibiotic dehydratase C-terminal domain-containing protein [Lactobacillus helveticus]|uniref:lantibiotic dehydratase C-terminal domain-containing protein n=1 Tax=Lactobacillus helveticus TaxID=1587 RepID=UPI0035CF0899
MDRQALLVYSSNAYILSRSVDIKENLNFIKYFDTQDKKDANKWFRENKDKVSSFEADSYINSLIQDRSIILRRLMTTSQISDDQKDEILLSLLHMSANRLIGVDRVLENRLMLATTNLIKANFYKHNV